MQQRPRRPAPPSPLRRVGILGFDGANAIDITGPAEAFSTAALPDPAGPPYQALLIGLQGRRFTTEYGLCMEAHCTVDSAPPLDTLLVPGGPGLRTAELLPLAAAFLRSRARTTRRVASVCTGIWGLAAAGLLDGRRVTTHWKHAAAVAARFPKLRVEPDPLYIKDGPFYTAAGVTAGIDLALALIEEDLGSEVALACAREMVVFLRRPGGQEQYSEPLRLQTRGVDRFADLVAHVAGHLSADLSVEQLARRACLSPRQFSRRFQERFGCTPGAFVEEQRLAEARRLLSRGQGGVEETAAAVGFGSADGLRRAFVRRFGVNPSDFASRFSLLRAASPA